ncbi:MAG: DUF3240 family protein [Sterolibacterium sp.]|jgi:hypothetical protein|nr:DUF3240 family protein [Sterolibacterium sp.]
MTDALLTLVVPTHLAEAVEDLLLAHPELVAGFTASHADGHGSQAQLTSTEERVAGHAPRMAIATVGPLSQLQALLALLKAQLPHANLYYWLTPVIARGTL